LQIPSLPEAACAASLITSRDGTSKLRAHVPPFVTYGAAGIIWPEAAGTKSCYIPRANWRLSEQR